MGSENEHIEGVVEGDFEVTDESIQDFISRGGEAPAYHPILQVWREILGNAEGELTAKVTPQWASRICASYREISFADMEKFRDKVFSRILELAAIVDDTIASDADCLTYGTPEEDVEHNSKHYKHVLHEWQKTILGWELAWDCNDPDAGVDLGSIAEVHKMFLGEVGLTGYLDNIRFQYTDEDRAELQVELEEMKAGTSE